MIRVLLIVAVLALLFGPGLWTRSVMRRHAGERTDFPGTGGELARHLLDELGLQSVAVEATTVGDHFDPQHKAVRLTADKHDGRSLTAIAVAAHEVGHAIQDRDNFRPLQVRSRLVRATAGIQRAGAIIVAAAPILIAFTHSPAIGVLTVGAGILTMGVSVIVHLVTLPVEFDASFNRALPILDRGGYLPKADLAAARNLLTAAAFTYAASSLFSLLNIWRWIRLFR